MKGSSAGREELVVFRLGWAGFGLFFDTLLLVRRIQ
jgi:hypothetical protein